MLDHIDRIICPEQVGSLIPLSQDSFQTPATKKIMLGMFFMDDMFDMDDMDGLLWERFSSLSSHSREVSFVDRH